MSKIPLKADVVVIAKLKLTGTFNAYLSGGLWTWNSKSDVAEEERTLIRKVPVVDGKAQVYMPYNGSLWWNYTSTINIKGFDAAGNEYVLLNWYLIFPVSYMENYKSDAGKVYVGFRLWKDWANFAAIPARGWGQSMLEVTLP